MARTLATAQRQGNRTSIYVVSESGNRFREVIKHSLKYCDYAIMNEIEAWKVTCIEPRDKKGKLIVSNLNFFCMEMLKMGVSDLAVIPYA